MNAPPFYLIEIKFFIKFVIFSIYIQQKVKKEWIFVISKEDKKYCLHFQHQNLWSRRTRTSPGGLAAVRSAKLFPFSFAVRRNLFATEMMAYSCSSASTIPSIFTTLLHGNKNHWAVVDVPWLSLPYYHRRLAVRELWSNPRHQAYPWKRGWGQCSHHVHWEDSFLRWVLYAKSCP